MARVHRLKSWLKYFEAVISGEKPFELRRDDRDYRVGDYIELLAYDPKLKIYLGGKVYQRISYILRGDHPNDVIGLAGLMPGYAVLALHPKAPSNEDVDGPIEIVNPP